MLDIAMRIAGFLSGSNDLGSPRYDIAKDYSTQLTVGTGAGAFDKIFADTRTISASSNDDIDLRGSTTDPFGVTSAIVELRFLAIKSAAANLNNIGVGGTVTNQITGIYSDASDQLILRPGMTLFLGPFPDGGVSLTAGTADLLRITNLAGTNSVTYDIFVAGVSA